MTNADNLKAKLAKGLAKPKATTTPMGTVRRSFACSDGLRAREKHKSHFNRSLSLTARASYLMVPNFGSQQKIISVISASGRANESFSSPSARNFPPMHEHLICLLPGTTSNSSS